MKTLEQLLASRCHPAKGAAMSRTETDAQLATLPGWSFDTKRTAIVRRYAFTDFHETIEFVNAVAWMIHGEDHHPDMTVGYDQCELAFSTHSVDGLSINDFICAAKCDAIRSIRPSRSAS